MKTIADLNALIPQLIEIVLDAPEVGENGAFAQNCAIYEEDGWIIEVSYKCTGTWDNDPGDYFTPPCHELIESTGIVTEVCASHYDDDEDVETTFTISDTKDLRNAIDEALKSF